MALVIPAALSHPAPQYLHDLPSVTLGVKIYRHS